MAADPFLAAAADSAGPASTPAAADDPAKPAPAPVDPAGLVNVSISVKEGRKPTWRLELTVDLRPDRSGGFTHRGDVNGRVLDRQPADAPESGTQVSGYFWIVVDQFLGRDLAMRKIVANLHLGDHYQLRAKQSWSIVSLLAAVVGNVTVPGVLYRNDKPIASLQLQIPLIVVLDYLGRLNS